MSLICSCVSDSEAVLMDVLGMFKDKGAAGYPFINLDEMYKVQAKYGDAVLGLILSLLDRMGYITHSGNLTSSSWLTERGIELWNELPTDYGGE